MSRFGQIQRLFYDTLMESQYWPRERLQALQRQHLGRLLRHARDEVPFYEDRLESVLAADGDVDFDRWESIPITTRSDLLEQRDQMQARALSASHGRTREETSSGSSGAMIHMTSTAYGEASQRGAVFRAHRWHDLDWTKPLLVMLPSSGAVVSGGTAGPPWGPVWTAAPQGRTHSLGLLTSANDALDYIERNHISYLSCRPKTAQWLALEAMVAGRTIALDAILTFGTDVRDDEIDDCHKAFGARMPGAYSSTEAQLIAYRCPSSDHYHINEEQCLVELVDAAGHAVRDGEIGRVVVTPLFNFAQPLIRYDHGDLAVFGPTCTCGRSLRVIERIVGRVTQLFHLPDGRRIAPRIPKIFREELGAQYWQLAQVAPLTFEVRYVPVAGTTADIAAATARVRAAVHPEAIINFRPQPDLMRVSGGKFMEYVREIEVT